MDRTSGLVKTSPGEFILKSLTRMMVDNALKRCFTLKILSETRGARVLTARESGNARLSQVVSKKRSITVDARKRNFFCRESEISCIIVCSQLTHRVSHLKCPVSLY